MMECAGFFYCNNECLMHNEIPEESPASNVHDTNACNQIS